MTNQHTRSCSIQTHLRCSVLYTITWQNGESENHATITWLLR